ncbi:hypothetical protein [Pseudoalteromonas rhizosphaerae]|uniref:Uncharacterized protein n=1 Tax=Pseudoalteromonas rhizosphaerae TaxID=2518973 RepID=A0ABW8KZL9_9GAMM
MILSEIIEKLVGVDETLRVNCSISSMGLISNVYVVGQVRPDYPGVVLGDREPHLREKIAGEFVKKLKTFGERFQENEFLLEQTIDIDKTKYEVRYFKLSDVKLESKALLLNASQGEVVEFREEHDQVESE